MELTGSNYILTSIEYMIVLALRTANQDHVTANSHSLSFYFDLGLKHYLYMNLIVGNIYKKL